MNVYLCMIEASRRRTWLDTAMHPNAKVCVRIDPKDMLKVLREKSTNRTTIFAGVTNYANQATKRFAYVDDTRVSDRSTKLCGLGKVKQVEWVTLRKPLIKQLEELLGETA